MFRFLVCLGFEDVSGLGLFGSVLGFEVVQHVYWVSGCLEFLVVLGFMSLQCLALLGSKKSVFEVLLGFLVVSVAYGSPCRAKRADLCSPLTILREK